MFYKIREVPVDLKIMRVLFWRDGLSEKDKEQYFIKEKGFEGERTFDKMLEGALPSDDWLIIPNLRLKWDGNEFQIDTLLISQHQIYLIEIKNREGDYFIEGDRWCSFYGRQIKNPLHQLERAELLLSQCIQSIGIILPIVSRVVFVNPEFALFQAPREYPIILPAQINRFLKQLRNAPSTLTKKHFELAKKLTFRHIKRSSHESVPVYTYDQLKKGIHCGSCHSFHVKLIGRRSVCQHCGYEEPLESAFMRSVDEFHTLFPERKITVPAIMDWCKLDIDRRRVGKILKKNMNFVFKSRHSYYLFKN
ncbi:nuclease-related domain-containing protein [Camelliibacillus cellulosilyticus]|uniref:Nuclease-related domain-containing protein n=1 Tax=Camelliibacillus cellulosilyticus TaxID=2174486 RepID=A0ABV9GPP6_9BACL